jgi:hypothetical protein
VSGNDSIRRIALKIVVVLDDIVSLFVLTK